MKSASDKRQAKVKFRKKEDLVKLPKIPNKLMDDIGIFLESEINGKIQ
ncbi:hypothetical protein [Acidithiobacillus acidisediminis]|nr:hypothetical protein [Acidithiobacillus sp. S30A2]